MKTALLLAALLLPALAFAEDNRTWTRFDTAMEATTAVTLALDWNQTIRIAAAGREINPYLGPHPARHTVNTYFASCIVLHAAVAYALPKPYRTIWQGVFIMVEAKVVRDNIRLGWGIKF